MLVGYDDIKSKCENKLTYEYGRTEAKERRVG